MADRDWRVLERAYLGGDEEVLPALNHARKRAGLPMIRPRIVHYLKSDYWHRLDARDEIDARVEQSKVWAPCGSGELWPRRHCKRKSYYTSRKPRITCKKCLRVINAKDFADRVPHFHLERPDHPEIGLCGGQFGRRTKIEAEVGCRGCRRVINGARVAPRVGPRPLNARGRRRLRRAQENAYQG